MPQFNASHVDTRTEQEWTPLDTGEYVMQIGAAKIAPSVFTNQDGEHEDQLKIRWELAEWREEWTDSGYQHKQAVFQQLRPWLGTGKKGDSKFKQLIDQLRAEGLVPEDFWIAGADDADNQGNLIGIKRRVLVEKYKKAQGPNAGSFGNRVLAVSPLKPQPPHTAAAPADTTAATAARPAPQPPAIPRRTAVTAVTTTAATPVAPPKVIPPQEYFDALLTESSDPNTPVTALLEIAEEFRHYAGGFWTTKTLASDPDEIRNQTRRMLGMINRNRSEANPDAEIEF